MRKMPRKVIWKDIRVKYNILGLDLDRISQGCALKWLIYTYLWCQAIVYSLLAMLDAVLVLRWLTESFTLISLVTKLHADTGEIPYFQARNDKITITFTVLRLLSWNLVDITIIRTTPLILKIWQPISRNSKSSLVTKVTVHIEIQIVP